MNDASPRNEEILRYVLALLPMDVSGEITAAFPPGNRRVINEIRLRADAPSAVAIGGRVIPLRARLDRAGVENVYMRICKGAPFVLRDSIVNGYIPLEYGVRVGVGGEARYENGAIVGIGRISVLVFRLPSAVCSFADALYREWSRLGLRNILISSPPAVGKTTALRALVRCLALDRRDKNIVVVDERCEFSASDYSDCNVDILSGYKRRLGIDIAIRTMSAHYVAVDEIGRADERDAMLMAYGCGVGVLASAHGESIDEIRDRGCLREIIEVGMFPLVALISRDGGKYSYRICEV